MDVLRGATRWFLKGRIDWSALMPSLAKVGFHDLPAAQAGLRRLSAMASDPAFFADCLPALLNSLAACAGPDRALIALEHLADHHDNPADLFALLAAHPRLCENVIILFAGSRFLGDILIRHPQYLDILKNRQRLGEQLSSEQLFVQVKEMSDHAGSVTEKIDELRCFQRRELLRIGAADLFGVLDLQSVTGQLSNLADALVRMALGLVEERLPGASRGMAVIALGKLGGRELNYSSDIDLLFLGETDRPQYRQAGQFLIEVLTRMTGEGFLYRVDMRLRPWGKTGKLVPSITEYCDYLSTNARLWEKQALLKGRYICGDEQVGLVFQQKAAEFVFGAVAESPSQTTMIDDPERFRREIHRMKQRIESGLRRRGQDEGEVKSGAGSIRDVEFITQYLQLCHGARRPEVRSRQTLDALARLTAAALLPADHYRTLSEGYIFLRTVEHYLQMMDYRQTHLLPEDSGELRYLALRLGFSDQSGQALLMKRYREHSRAIRKIYEHYLESAGDPLPAAAPPSQKVMRTVVNPTIQHLQRMEAAYSEVFTAQEIEEHARLAMNLNPEHPASIAAEPLPEDRWRITIVGYDFIGELSLICGLLFVYELDITEGQIFTYEAAPAGNGSASQSRMAGRPVRQGQRAASTETRRKIVDVFTVRSLRGPVPATIWDEYLNELNTMLIRLRKKQIREVQGDMAKRVAGVLAGLPVSGHTLLPVDIEIDNTASEKFTVLRIDAADTAGFLFEFTNALALNGIYIARVVISSVGERVHDTLFVTGSRGQKITDSHQQRQLRAAAVLVKHFTHLLPRCPNPQSAILHFRELVSQLFTHPHWPDELGSVENPEVLEALARLLGVSDFLWEDFLRMQHENLFPLVMNLKALENPKPSEQLEAELAAAIAGASGYEAQLAAINAFKDEEMFRIDMRYIQNYLSEFWQFSSELSDLAEVVVRAVEKTCAAALTARFGEARLRNQKPCRHAVCALGKFGGRELGFGSDIELLFIYEGEGATSGPQVISNAEYFARLAQNIKEAVRTRREGIFEIDLRLRPYGERGNLSVPVREFESYYAAAGPAWDYERQALVRLRPIAGDGAFGRKILAVRDRLIYGGHGFDAAAMRGMRERQIRQLVSGGTVNAKYSPGGLVDLEYLVQGLQINHGEEKKSLRTSSTRDALRALAREGILPAADAMQLEQTYLFLRRLIEALRMVRGNSRDLTVPPEQSEEFAFLARRLEYSQNVNQLQQDLLRHTAYVQELVGRLLPV